MDPLINELKEWQEKNNLPSSCAFEQLAEQLTNDQEQWLKNYIIKWDNAENGDGK